MDARPSLMSAQKMLELNRVATLEKGLRLAAKLLDQMKAALPLSDGKHFRIREPCDVTIGEMVINLLVAQGYSVSSCHHEGGTCTFELGFNGAQ
jgi:hypothetical protein